MRSPLVCVYLVCGLRRGRHAVLAVAALAVALAALAVVVCVDPQRQACSAPVTLTSSVKQYTAQSSVLKAAK